jgi:hypothetical protein
MIDLGTAESFQRQALVRDLLNDVPIEELSFDIWKYMELLTSTSKLVEQYRSCFGSCGRREGRDLRDVWYNAVVLFSAMHCQVRYGEWIGRLTAMSFSNNYLYAHLRGIGNVPHGNLDVKVETLNIPKYDILDKKTPQQIVEDMIVMVTEYKLKSGNSC